MLRAVTLLLMLASTHVFAETRCGWIDNPTPANYWITDSEATWIMSVQGGFQAQGLDELAYPDQKEYVKRNGNYGYWCGCVSVVSRRSDHHILKIMSSRAKKLRDCLQDPNLPNP